MPHHDTSPECFPGQNLLWNGDVPSRGIFRICEIYWITVYQGEAFCWWDQLTVDVHKQSVCEDDCEV